MKCIPVLVCLLPATIFAADVHTIRATADATVQAMPDRANITLAVRTDAPDAASAGSQNAQRLQRVLGELRRVIGDRGTLKTIGYSVQPQVQYAPNTPPKVTGYQAANTVEASLDDLNLTGKVIDAALEAGANEISGIAFTLRDPSKSRDEALAEAAWKARTSAEAIAAALHLKVVAVVSADTTAPNTGPRPMVFAALKQQGETPINTGTLDITASVTVVVAVE